MKRKTVETVSQEYDYVSEAHEFLHLSKRYVAPTCKNCRLREYLDHAALLLCASSITDGIQNIRKTLCNYLPKHCAIIILRLSVCEYHEYKPAFFLCDGWFCQDWMRYDCKSIECRECPTFVWYNKHGLTKHLCANCIHEKSCFTIDFGLLWESCDKCTQSTTKYLTI
jgi:hypothetical protein